MHSTVTHRPRPARSKDGELRHLMNLTAVGVTLAGVILLSVILYAAWAANSSRQRSRDRPIRQRGQPQHPAHLE